MFTYYQISHLSPSTLIQALFTYVSPSTQKQPLCLPVMQQSADQTQPAVAVVSAYSFPVRFSVWFGTSVESVA